MNERIRQLAEQAGMKECALGYGMPENVLWGDDQIKNFAELIVRECAWIANDPAPSVYDHDSYKLGRKFAGIDVLKHFGVEE